jgi:vacuolar protein sorting-associated protein 13A/C
MLKQMQIDESSKVILLGNPLYTQISLHDEIQGSILSKDINMNSTGNDSVSLTHPTDLQVYELGINLSLVCVDQSLQLFTKVLTISPRFVIVNFTDLLLRVVQEDSSSDPYEIKSQQRLPFTWSRCDKPKQYRVQLVEFTYQKEVYWGYSQPLDPNQAGFTCFTLRSMRNRSSIKYVSC